jgi:hypothetical protein
MQKRILITASTISLCSILLMGLLQVNRSKATPLWNSNPKVVDGIPMPPPPPIQQPGTSVVADGIPMPPPPAGENTWHTGRCLVFHEQFPNALSAFCVRGRQGIS